MRLAQTISRSWMAATFVGAMLMGVATAQAGVMPAPVAPHANPDVQLAWCAAGLHIGPLGGCIVGGPNYYAPHPGYYYGGPRRCWINPYGVRVCRGW
jgi:hypothetical protein